MTVSIQDQIKEVAREIALRRNVYKGFVRNGRLTQEVADRQLGAMEAVIETLKVAQAAQIMHDEDAKRTKPDIYDAVIEANRRFRNTILDEAVGHIRSLQGDDAIERAVGIIRAMKEP